MTKLFCDQCGKEYGNVVYAEVPFGTKRYDKTQGKEADGFMWQPHYNITLRVQIDHLIANRDLSRAGCDDSVFCPDCQIGLAVAYLAALVKARKP